MYLKNSDSIEQQALQGDDVSKQMRIHGDMENEVLE
jgi:hypothetical protein